ncbi:hypothetical protein ACFY2W_28585 [Streptomyces sp. NPDC001262]|uniref:hypothetical protein n=1 Tax=Streptomyces sp. NPDC001262 TaxID=3364552 RepID=UPI003675976F
MANSSGRAIAGIAAHTQTAGTAAVAARPAEMPKTDPNGTLTPAVPLAVLRDVVYKVTKNLAGVQPSGPRT